MSTLRKRGIPEGLEQHLVDLRVFRAMEPGAPTHRRVIEPVLRPTGRRSNPFLGEFAAPPLEAASDDDIDVRLAYRVIGGRALGKLVQGDIHPNARCFVGPRRRACRVCGVCGVCGVCSGRTNRREKSQIDLNALVPGLAPIQRREGEDGIGEKGRRRGR